ncbi:MAG TPA: argininosuccinate lyase [Candidatus Desulfofervidus auxilii]|uniref:Argininosuccinate lyase n=1 Tax=Desulfofervidus auxilii TaxID=1621989 RepID=A0A7C0U294_DESA2|nr:argininosuccinate lyase [Candidatus Desulfofervidus auxilii]
MKLWGGRFSKETAKEVEEFTSSLSFDKRLYKQDIFGSIAHVKMLSKQGIISEKDAKAIIKALEEIKKEIEKGNFKFLPSDEDIHTAIERVLREKLGNIAAKLHTARSRNDQIVLDMRLFLKEEIKEIIKLIQNLQKVLLNLAKKNIDIILPGYTHLQRAQPVLLSHHLLAYVEMFKRDIERFKDCYRRVDVMPLGSAALAGTSFPIDRNYVAELLGFSQVSQNSMDAVSDRDFILEFLSNSTILAMHLSRMAEELIIWNTQEFNFIEIDDAFCTGSSIMPQKKNPDVLELIRGKTGRVYGNLIAVLTMMKGLPLTYNRDMQEDKEPLFDTIDTIKPSLKLLAILWENIKFKKENMIKATEKGFLLATDLADYLVTKGLPFREAHNLVGEIVKYCQEKGKELYELSIKEIKKFSDLFEDDIKEVLNIENAIKRKKSFGGTAPDEVKRQIELIEREIQ